MKIINEEKLNSEMEYIEELRLEADGHINDEIILYCDYSGRTKKSLILFFERLFYNCGVSFNTKDQQYIRDYFNNNINYYSIKEYFLGKIDELRNA